jgi:TPR repeat protein
VTFAVTLHTTIENANDAYERADFATARNLYEALAKEGHVSCMVPLARMYIDGEGGDIDLQRAEALLEQAIALGVKEGVLQKAALFRARNDPAGYFRCISEASSLGMLPAQYQLALCYQTGDGVSVDRDKALEVMQAAANRGHLGAKMFLGRRMLANPLRPAEFLMGLFMFVSASIRSIYLVFHDPRSDLFR